MRFKRWSALVRALAIFLILAARFFHHAVDDAYITFRYAKNLAAGYGPVFNVGEAVEGYTNFLWMVLLAFGFKLHLDPLSAARWLGLAAGALIIVAAARFSERYSSLPRTLWFAPLFLAAHPAMAVWATAGLETPLFACFVTWGCGLAAFESEAGALRPWSALVLALAALTRPEGALIAAAVAILAVLPGPRPKPSLRNAAVWAAVFLAVWLPYFLWRWSYYDYLFPNTFYAKVDLGGAELTRGLRQLHEFFKVTGYWLLIAIVGLAFVPLRRSVLVIGGVTILFLSYVVYIGGDGLVMYRFFVPVLALFVLLVVWGLEGWRQRVRPGPFFATSVMVALGIGLVWTARAGFTGPDHYDVQRDVKEVAAWRSIGLWFRDHAKPDESLAVFPAGAMPYYSGLRTIDMFGLNDATIAHTPMPLGVEQAGHEKFNVGYVLERSPTYVVVGVYNVSSQAREPSRMLRPYYPAEHALLASEPFRRRYRAEIAQTDSHKYFVYFTLIR